MGMAKLFICFISTLFLPVTSSLNVPIQVKTSTALTSPFPAQVVVPLPRGLVFNKDVLGLAEIPSQIKVLEQWRDDGSLRHVQVLFIVEPSSPNVLHLVDSGSVLAPATPVLVTEDATLITVNTGKVRFTVKKTNFNLFDNVWVDYNADGAYADSEKIVVSNSANGGTLVDHLNRIQLDSKRSDVLVTIEESGPVRVVLRAEAPTRFVSTTNITHGFAVRIYAYAGQEYVPVDYQLQNSARVVRAWPLYFHEMNLNLDLNLASSTSTLIFGATDGSTQTTSSPAYLAQEFHNAYSIYSGSGSLIKQKKDLTYAAISQQTGFVNIRDTSQGRSVTVVGRNFWQMWPNGLSVNGKQLSVQLFPSWSAQWEGAIPSRRTGRISPTGLYWLKDMQHVYKSVLFAFHATVPSTNSVSELAKSFQYGLVASVSPDWYGQTRATLDLGGYVPPNIVANDADTVSPDKQWSWDTFLNPADENYRANVRNCGDPEGPYRADPAIHGGWPYPSSAFHATRYSSDYHLAELWGIGEMNVRPQWLTGYNYLTDQATLKLTENPYGGGTWRVFDGHGISVYAGPLLSNTGEIAPDYGARDDQHGWFYHAMDAYFITGNLWIKDWYEFIHEFRKVRLNQGDPFPDRSSRGLGHSLAHVIQAGRVLGASDVLPAFRSYLINYLIPTQDPRYGQQLTSVEDRGGGFETGYLMRTTIAYLEEVRGVDSQGFAEAFNYLSGLMAWNLNYGNFAYQFNVDGSGGAVGQSSGTGLTIVDPQAWYYWNTGKIEYWNHIVDYIDGGINGGETPFGDGFGGWGGSFEGRMYQYVLQTSRTQVTPPSGISDLVASRDGSGQVTTQWTTPLRARRFHLVWSDIAISEQLTAIATKRNWWACKTIGVSLTAIPGSKQSFSFNAPGAKFVAMFVFDAVNNMSPMSNLATVIDSVIKPTIKPTSKPLPAPIPAKPTKKPTAPPTLSNGSKPTIKPTIKATSAPSKRSPVNVKPGSLSVAIQVKTSSTLPPAFPSQVVVPLPKGLVFNKDVLGLAEIPSQVKVLERWRDDGSLRHVQVIFILQPSSPKVLHLVNSGSFLAPSAPVRVTENPTVVTVDTGKVRFTVRKKNFNLFDNVWVDYNADGVYANSEKIVVSNASNGGILVDYLNRIQLDSKRSDVRVTIEESGPLRAVIRAEAPTRFESTRNHTHGFAVRIFAYAGQDYVPVDYQLQNSALVKRAWPLYFHEMNLNLDLNLATLTPTLVFGTTDGSTQTTSSPAALAQEFHNAYSIYSGGGSLIKQKKDLTYTSISRRTGFVHIQDKSRGRSVTVVGRNFWQMWPNGLSVKGKQLSVQLFPSWSAQWEGATLTRPTGRISPTGLYWLKDIQHVYKSVLFAFHSTLPSIDTVSKLAQNFQYGPVASVSPNWYGQTRATLDLGGYVPPKVVATGADTVSPDAHWPWEVHLDPTDSNYRANVRNFGDPEGPYRADPALHGGWPYASSVFYATRYSSDFFWVELWGIGEVNVRPQWLAGYDYSTDQATLQLTENPYGGGTWRVFDGHGVTVYAAPLLSGTEDVAPDYGARDDQHAWFYHAIDAYFITGNPWIKDWYTFIHEFRMVRLNQRDPFPDRSSRGLGHSLAHALQAGRVTGAADVLPAFRSYLINYLIPDQDPRYGQQLTSVEDRGGSFGTGYLGRTVIAYLEEVRGVDPQGFAEGFNYLSGLMAWNLNYGNFAHEFNFETSGGAVGKSAGSGLTLVDPQAWYYWNTGKIEYWNHIVDYVDGGINGGEAPFGDGFGGWGGSFEGRMYQYVLQTSRVSLAPPSGISDLVATKDGSGQVTIQWTTPAGAKRFHLVWSDIPISEQHTTIATKRNWWACKTVGVSLNAVSGSKQTISFNAPGAKFVAMFVFDAVNNMSAMSNLASVTVGGS